MKKIITLLLALVMVLSLVACGNKKGETKKDTTTESKSESKKEVKSLTGAITVISREDGSGTRGAFTELVELRDKDGNDLTTQTAVVQDGNGKLIETVKGSPKGIGYASLGSVLESKDVKVLSVDGVEASPEKILSGDYKLARPFNIAWKKGIEQKPQVLDFVKYILSKDGQDLGVKEGYITVDPNAAPFGKAADVKGEIILTGSTSVTPLMQKLSEAYMALNPNVTIKISGTGSSAGMKDAISGNNDLGMASRNLKDNEKAELEHKSIAKDGIAVIVNKENTLKNISSENVKEIYLGKLLNWEDVK